MNCLLGDPTEAKELPLIRLPHRRVRVLRDRLRAGMPPESWGDTFGAWEPSTTRWPHGIKYVFGKIRSAGMIARPLA